MDPHTPQPTSRPVTPKTWTKALPPSPRSPRWGTASHSDQLYERRPISPPALGLAFEGQPVNGSPRTRRVSESHHMRAQRMPGSEPASPSRANPAKPRDEHGRTRRPSGGIYMQEDDGQQTRKPSVVLVPSSPLPARSPRYYSSREDDARRRGPSYDSAARSYPSSSSSSSEQGSKQRSPGPRRVSESQIRQRRESHGHRKDASFQGMNGVAVTTYIRHPSQGRINGLQAPASAQHSRDASTLLTSRSSSMSSLPPMHMPQSRTSIASCNTSGSRRSSEFGVSEASGLRRSSNVSSRGKMTTSRSEHTGLEALGLAAASGNLSEYEWRDSGMGLRSRNGKATMETISVGNLAPLPHQPSSRIRTPSPSDRQATLTHDQIRASPRSRAKHPPSPSRSPKMSPSTAQRRQQRPLTIVPPPPPFIRATSFVSSIGDDSGSAKPSPPIPARNPLRTRMNTRSTSTLKASDGAASGSGGGEQARDAMADRVKSSADQQTASSADGAVLLRYERAGASATSPTVTSDGSAVASMTPGMQDLIGAAEAAERAMANGSVGLSPLDAGPNQGTNSDRDKSLPFPRTGQSPPMPPPAATSRSIWPNELRPSGPSVQPAVPPRSPSLPEHLHVGVGDGLLPSSMPTRSPGNLRVDVRGMGPPLSTSPLNGIPSLSPRQSQSSQHLRSQSIPVGPLASPNFSTSSIDSTTLRSPTRRLTKRAHLLREICATERSFARDLALVRDAYLYRLRPEGTQLSLTGRASSIFPVQSPGGISVGSRISTYTFDTADTRRSSVSEGPLGMTPTSAITPASDKHSLHTRSSGYFAEQFVVMPGVPPAPDVITAPLVKVPTPQLSPRTTSLPTGISTLSAADVKAVFLNLEDLARFARELADQFDTAKGDGSGAEVIESTRSSDQASAHESDRLGKAFLTAVSRTCSWELSHADSATPLQMPKLQSLYMIYCSRQAAANTRLMEIMADPKQAAYFNECWSVIQPFTNAWDLGSMLIKPVQRVMKYPMLFADLLACTSPVHPDYFDLRKAAEGARIVADEINEAKRRKDVVERVVSAKRPTVGTTLPTPEKPKSSVASKFGKRFRKEKSVDKTVRPVSSIASATITISVTAEAQLREGIARLEAGDKVVRRVGKEVNAWPDKVRDVWLAQRAVMVAWHSCIQLDPTDPQDERLEAFAVLTEKVLKGPLATLVSEMSNVGLNRADG